MFLVRSAFWLTVAFVAFHPHDIDLGATASAVVSQAELLRMIFVKRA